MGHELVPSQQDASQTLGCAVSRSLLDPPLDPSKWSIVGDSLQYFLPIWKDVRNKLGVEMLRATHFS